MTEPIGLALGGGGSRALCHLGILTALEEAGVPVGWIAGSSMGAILGGLYAYTADARKTRRLADEFYRRSSFFGGTRRPKRGDGLHARRGALGWLLKYLQAASISNMISLRKSLFWMNPAKKSIHTLLPETNIEDLSLPFACVALNLTEGRLETLRAGPVREALCASTAVGVVLPPYRMNGGVYIDPAPLSAVPVRACRALGATRVLAVDIRTALPVPFTIQNGFDVIRRIESVASKTLNDQETGEADIVLAPEVGDWFWGDFSHLDPIIAAGEAAVRENLAAIRALCEGEAE